MWVALPLAAQRGAPLVIAGSQPANSARADRRYEQLVGLFNEWRAFQRPRLVNGVPDYTAVAMAAQQRGLVGYQRRLAAIDTAGWSIAQQVDYQIVRAEMNGLDFDHRVLRPWARDPGFYVTIFTDQSDQPAREGPHALGAVELWTYSFPLTAQQQSQLATGLRAIPPLLAQAKSNLTGDGADLWLYGAKELRQQSADLAALDAKLGKLPSSLHGDVQRAHEATDALAAWAESKLPSKKGKSGIGVANYDWYLKNVQLVPWTWRDEVTLMQRELARSRAALALEEQKNRALPELVPVASVEEHKRRFDAGVAQYVAFLKARDILTVQDWMGPQLRAHTGDFVPGPREFFTEVDYRDPEVMRTHGYHWFDLWRMANEPNPSPIRRGPLLYNIFNTRTEGHATGWEEMMLNAGMFDDRPRTRELVYILLAERAARALGDLRMQSNEFTVEQAAAFASANVPRNWLRLDGQLVRWEQHLYLTQPGYGTSYVVGKIEVERLLEERRRQLGDRFTMKAFMDEFDRVGLVPASLVRWQTTGQTDDELLRMLKPK